MSEDCSDTMSWEELLEFLLELKVLDPERLKKTVTFVDCGGSDNLASYINRDHNGNPYIVSI